MNEDSRPRIADLEASGVLVINDGYRAKNDELSLSGLPFARAGNINNGFHFNDADHFPEETLHKVGSKISQPGDVLFTSKGTVGRFAYVRPDTPRFVYSPQLCFWRVIDTSTINSRFLYYWMHYDEFTRQSNGVKGQTDMADYVSLRDQRAMRITLPSLSRQEAVANILGTLDDKIELNRRLNETLEEMARTLFRSWFTDFDPVKAKANGRTPDGMNQSTAGLFPTSFDESELGTIPQGWAILTLRQLADVTSGGTPSKKIEAYWNGDIPWISPKAMDSIHVHFSDEQVTEAALGNGTRLVPSGTVLVMVRGMGLHQGVRISQAQCDVAFNQDVKALIPKAVSGSFLLYAMLDSRDFLFSKVQASGHGTGVLPTDILDSLTFAVPPDDVCKRLTSHIDSLNKQLVVHTMQNRTLANIRDALLSKLLSGELRMKDAERFVEATL